MHLDEGTMQRLLDAELTPAEAGSCRDHLAACDECRRMADRMRSEEREVGEWLRVVDVPAPPLSLGTIVRAAERRPSARMRWAAALLVALGAAGVALGFPGSPLRHWVDDAVQRLSGNRESPAPPSPSPDSSEPSVAGISVAPGEHLVVSFVRPQEGARVRVSLYDGRDVLVTGPGGSASFTSEADRLVIDNRRLPILFEARIPRSAPRVEIRVAGRRVLLKEGASVVPELDSTGAIILPL